MRRVPFIVFILCVSTNVQSAQSKTELVANTPSKKLLAAVKNKEPVEVIQRLIESKAGVEAVNDDAKNLCHYNWRPIDFASFYNNLPVVQILLQARATVDRDEHGSFSPVKYTTNHAVAQVLFEHGASPDNIQGFGIGWDNIPLFSEKRALEVAFTFGLIFDENLKATMECQKEWYTALVTTYQANPPHEVRTLREAIQAHVTITPLAQLVMSYFCKHNLDGLAQLNKAKVEKKGLAFQGTTQKQHNMVIAEKAQLLYCKSLELLRKQSV